MILTLAQTLGRFVVAFALVAGEGGPALAADDAPAAEPATAETPVPLTEAKLCDLIETAARDHNLPIGFFTRLIWKESRFRSDAVSPKGAQGIAQFMPGTASDRALDDPFDPLAAIPASANFLADLRDQFGNLGLAAAAYNAGAQRVTDWVAGDSTLPWETEDYVFSVTGLPAAIWAAPEGGPTEAPATYEDDDRKGCTAIAADLKVHGFGADADVATAHGPWGVQVAGNFSKAKALASYAGLQRRFPSLIGSVAPMVIGGRMRGRGTRAFYRVRVPQQSRQAAEELCRNLQKAGGDCVVLKT